MDKDLGVFKSILLFAFVIISCLIILNIPEKTGLSDNGDYIRITDPTGLTSLNLNNARYFYQSEYKMDVTQLFFFDCIKEIWQENIYQDIDYTTTQFFFINMAKTFNYIANIVTNTSISHFSMFFLAIQYILIFAFAFWLLYKSFRTDNIIKNILILAIFTFIFFDLSYIIYFNSLYGEALQYCSLMLITAILLYTVNCFKQGERLTAFNYFLLFIFFVFTFIFAGAKPANIPIGITYALTGITITLLTSEKITKILLTITGCICIVLCIINLTKTPEWMNNVTNYNSVFYGILKGSDDPKGDLLTLDIDGKYISLTNTTAYNSQYKYNIYSEEFTGNVYDTLSKTKVVKYYLFHPVRFLEKVDISLQNASVIKPLHLGNYENINHEQLDTNNNFSLWSSTRDSLNITAMPFFLLLCFIITCVLVIGYIVYFKKYRNNLLPNQIRLYETPILSIIVYTCIFISLIMALVIPFIANGEADLQKHMFLFNNIYDLLIACFLAGFIMNIDKWIWKLKEKFEKLFFHH